MYSLYITPKNPVPKAGWIQVTYPDSITVESEQDFLDVCEAVTSDSYKGPSHCAIDISQRQITIYDVFRDQDFYTSEINLKFLFKNPIYNLWYKDETAMTDEERD